MKKKNYRLTSLVNLGIKTISKILTDYIQWQIFFKMHLDQVEFIPEIQKQSNFGKPKFQSPN